ncbi:MAG: hypothetical protein C0469_17210 [Cyanobacteria bacterium DS2.3.42]|nr:hypothetical protein [Cyanobacteria bacterium DS2.3.42]
MVQPTSVLQRSKGKSRYSGRRVVLTTKHGKAAALSLPLKAGLGLLLESVELDTDLLGTFTGEIERVGTPVETAIKKARLGMNNAGLNLGLANEGSFGPHPYIPFIPGCHEVIVFIDDNLGIEVTESIVSASTNFGHIDARSIEEVGEFLVRVKFPSHGLIVRPNKSSENLLNKMSRIFTGKSPDATIKKGIRDRDVLAAAILDCAKLSGDGLAHIETDMRAHMNPTRLRVLRALGIRLARRLLSNCPECDCPGFGITGAEGALPCEECDSPSEAPSLEIHTCQQCHLRQTHGRKDGITSVEATYCRRCNP